MKKVLSMLLVMALFLFGFMNVNAASKKLELTNIEIEDKSNTITVDNPTISSNEIKSNIQFNEINDYVEFKLTIKNIEKEKIKINSISDNLDNDNIEISYVYDSNNYIDANGLSTFNIKMVYKNQLINVDKLKIDDLKITIKLVKEDSSPVEDDIIINPETGDSFNRHALLLGASVLGLIALIILVMVLIKERKLKLASLVIVLSLVAIPLISRALEEFEVVIKCNILVVKGEFEEYTVNFDSDGGTIVESQIVTFNEKVTKPSNPTKEGYTFDNWYLDEKVFDFNTKVTSNLELKAKYKLNEYTITFDTDGGTAIDSEKVTHNEKVSRPNDPEKTGYTFDNWYLNDEVFDFDTNITSNLTIKAKYTINEYTVNFDADGGTPVESQTVKYNEKVIKPSDPEKEGYTFDNWYLGNDVYNFDTKVTDNLELKAKYTINEYSVTFDSDGGTPIESQTVKYNEKATVPSIPIKTGYIFTNWYLDDEIFDFDTKITGNITLKAKYDLIDYTITYNLGNGTVTGNPPTYTIEDDDIDLNQPTPEAHYVFDGWSGTDIEGKEKNVTIPSGSTGDREFTANYSLEKFTVTFETDGGTAIDSQTVEYGSHVTKPTDNPEKEGFVFDNWYTTDSYNTVFDFDNMIVEETTTIYAHWVVFPVLYEHTASCTFNGHNNVITGDNCEYAGQYYVDTNVPLYTEDNYKLDYEIGFTIEDFVPTNNIKQATLVNAKYENEELNWPGLVVRRRDSYDQIEISETIHGEKISPNFNYNKPTKVRIIRYNEVVYYSINDGVLEELQNLKDTSDYFETTTWFGASQALNGNPQREFVGTLSNMYIKLGKFEKSNITITFDANGGTVAVPTKEVQSLTPVGELPIAEDADLEFAGWYTDPERGELITNTSLLPADITLYAHWQALEGIAKIGDDFYTTIQDALDAPIEGKVTIKLLSNTNETIKVREGKNIVLDLNHKVLRNVKVDSTPVVDNKGTVEIINGTLASNGNAAVINNESTGNLVLDNVTVEATGKRQGIYNNGGTATIKGSSIIKSSTTERAAIQILSGNVSILDAKVISSNYHAIVFAAGTLTIGEKDDIYNTSLVTVQGAKDGINASANLSIYDGTIKGIDNAINNEGKITGVEDDSTIVRGTETIDSAEYKTIYYTIN